MSKGCYGKEELSYADVGPVRIYNALFGEDVVYALKDSEPIKVENRTPVEGNFLNNLKEGKFDTIEVE